MSVAIYLRVSTDAQSVDSQEVAISNFLKAQGHSKWKIYKDHGVSGVKTSRPGLNQLLEDVKAGTVGLVYVYSLSRISRSVIHLLETLQTLERANVGFVSITEAIDLRTPSGKLLLTILASISAFEREIIIQRVRAGLDAAKKRGKVLGRKKSRNSELIQRLYAQGLSYRNIAKAAQCSVSAVQREVSKLPQIDNLKMVVGV